MLKVRILKTGEIKEVTRNEALGLVESGVAEKVVVHEAGIVTTEIPQYKNRQMKAVSKTHKSK